jgi:hypothetical protein
VTGKAVWPGRWSGPVLGSYQLERVIWFLRGLLWLRITLLTGMVAAPGGSRWFLVIKMLSVLSFLEFELILK